MTKKSGFTVVELVVVILVGMALTGIASNAVSAAKGRMAAGQALNTFASLHARNRAIAIEFGETSRLWIDFGGDSVWIQRGSTVVEKVRFADDLGVDIRGTGTLRLCMNPRGFADLACNSFSSPQDVVFAAGSDTTGLQIRTLGQLYY